MDNGQADICKVNVLDMGRSRQAGRISSQAPEAQECIELAAMIDRCCNAALTAPCPSVLCPSSHGHTYTFGPNKLVTKSSHHPSNPHSCSLQPLPTIPHNQTRELSKSSRPTHQPTCRNLTRCSSTAYLSLFPVPAHEFSQLNG